MQDSVNLRTIAVMSIIRTADIVNRCLDIELRKLNTSPARFAVMNALVVHGGTMSPSKISKWIFRAKHSVTSMLQVLESIGYVKRKPNGNDRRSVNIVVTKEGWKSLEEMIPRAEDMNQKILACLDEKQIETLMEILKQIRRHLLSKFRLIETTENIEK
jgi:DNA-binding MarR family transcriptional regulator